MISRRVKKVFPLVITALAVAGIFHSTAWSSVGQSAVITLVFPPGARATGLGEAFTGLANDANAIYFNPAGLGLDPLANSWKSFLDGNGPFYAVASKRKSEFMTNELVWAANRKGIMRYTGKMWESYEIYLVEQGDDLKSIAHRYLSVDDEKLLADASWKIRTENGLEMKRYAMIVAKIRARLPDSILTKSKHTVESLARELLDVAPASRSAAKLYGVLSPIVDSVTADKLSDEVKAVFDHADTELKDLVELHIPFSIAVSDSVTAMTIDESDRLWVGTPHGLWRCGESKWSRITVADGLPSNAIIALAVDASGNAAVGTDAGIGLYKDGRWTKIGTADGLPDSIITAVAFGREGTLYAGCAKGLIRRKDTSTVVFDTANGLLSRQVLSLFSDSKDRLWIGGENGISIYTGTAWKRYKFPGSVVHCFAEQKSGTVWIGTNKGVITFTEGKTVTTPDGKILEGSPDWKTYHSKNALHGDDVRGLASFGNDIWIPTEKAINKYEWAQKQALLFYERLLPAFKITDLWHMFGGFVYPTEDWGTLGFSINFINMGMNVLYDEQGVEKGNIRSWEGVFGLSYGLSLSQSLSLGLNIKYVNSALAPGIDANGGGVGKTYAIDAAVLKRDLFIPRLNLGFMMQNMGPSIYYITEDHKDPIPFTLRLGTSYTAVQTPIHELTLLLDLDREVVHTDGNTPDPFIKALWTDLIHDPDYADSSASLTFNRKIQEVNAHLGAEYWYSHFLALRSGFLFDYIGERYELTLGMGLNYSNMNFDFSYIYSPEGFLKSELQWFNEEKTGATGARHGQWRVSMLFKL
jgi:ligand-binding sensor domain-containing protein